MAASLPFIGLGISGFGTATSFLGQRAAGKQAMEIGQMNAELAVEDTLDSMEESRSNFTALMSRQRSLYAKAGVDINTGSPLLAYIDTAMKQAKEAGQIKRRGEREADIYRKGGAAKQKASNIGATTTLLTGIGQGLLTGYQLVKANG